LRVLAIRLGCMDMPLIEGHSDVAERTATA
jgi:hypothetical protein